MQADWSHFLSLVALSASFPSEPVSFNDHGQQEQNQILNKSANTDNYHVTT